MQAINVPSRPALLITYSAIGLECRAPNRPCLWLLEMALIWTWNNCTRYRSLGLGMSPIRGELDGIHAYFYSVLVYIGNLDFNHFWRY